MHFQSLISRLLVSCVAVTITALPCVAGEIEPASAQDLLDEAFAPLFSTDDPGCVYGIARNGDVIAHGVGGLANLELAAPLKRNSRFDIGSTSKQFTAASAAILARRGKLDLDADIRRYVPEMHAFDPPIRVRHLIHHSSGLYDPYEPLSWLYNDEYGTQYPSDYTLRMAFGMKTLKSEPGTVYEYSNLGYLLLGLIVERVSGVSLREFADENIFKPLGMSETHFHDNAKEIVPNRASAYRRTADGAGWEWTHSDFTVMGDGGVYSTLDDLAKWYGVFSDPSKLEGGKRLFDLLLTPGEYSEKGATFIGLPIKYGFGIQMYDDNGVELIGHPGGWAGYVTTPYFVRAADATLITLCNTRYQAVVGTTRATLRRLHEIAIDG